MNRTAIALAFFWAALGGAGLSASAQAALALGDAAGRAPAVGAEVAVGAIRASGAEPKELAGMLVRQNEARARVKSRELFWASDLEKQTQAKLVAETKTSCGVSAIRRLAIRENLALHWSAPMRRMDGAGMSQGLSAGFIVSEWSAAGTDFDPATGQCKRTGDCENYKRMIAPEARLVGCARVTCDTGAQVIACSYAPAAPVRR